MLPYTLVFCLWDEEEQGLIGSKAYTAQAAANEKQIIGYINVDMLGWDSNDDHVADIHVRPVAQSIDLANKAIMVDSIYEIGLDIHLVNFAGRVATSIYNSEGKRVKSFPEEYQQQGKYALIWNDNELPAGIYWCKWLISIPNKPSYELSKPIFLLR